MSNIELFTRKVNGSTAGRDLLVYNINEYPNYKEVVKGMLQDIRNDDIDENLELSKEENSGLGEDKLFNTEYQYIGHSIEVINEYFKVAVGITPNYQHEKLKIIIIEKDIDQSRVISGISYGPYGSGIRSSEILYSKMKKGKYKEYIEKWHKELYQVIN